jgi:hypothetical protein
MASPAQAIDYSNIKTIHLSFLNHAMSAHYSDDVQNFSDYFTGNVLDDELFTSLTTSVKMCLEENTVGDPTRIPLLLGKMFFKYRSTLKEQEFKSLRTQAHLEAAFNEMVATNSTSLHIHVMTSALFFDPNFTGADLDQIHTSQDDLNDASPATVPVVVPRNIPSFPSPASFIQPTTMPSTNEFLHHLLPSDVKQRYDDHQDPNVIVPVSDLVPFQATPYCLTPSKYFYQPNIAGEKVIVRNGAVLSSVHDPKNFHKTVPYCHNVSYHGLRSWYKLFSGHGNANGIYIVPYELLLHGHGGSIGFAFDDDLPSHKSGYSFAWQNDILRALQNPAMFPADSIYSARVKTLTNGYAAILAILHDSHPAFVTHPVTLCKNWPEQKPGQSIFEFHAEFTEAISLRAIFMNSSQDLNSPLIMSTFMQNCNHSAYLIAAARLDKLDPTTSHQLTPGNLAITLSNYLARADSPSQLSIKHSSPSSSRFGEGTQTRFRGTGRPFQRRINALGEEADQNYDAEFEAQLDEHMPAMIHQLARDGPALRHCMFCGVGHMHLFDQCPILNETKFLNSFAIRVGSAYQRTLNDAFKRQKEAHGIVNTGTPQSLAARIHQVFGATDPAPTLKPEPAPVPLHPDFLSPDFIPGQPPDFLQG